MLCTSAHTCVCALNMCVAAYIMLLERTPIRLALSAARALYRVFNKQIWGDRFTSNAQRPPLSRPLSPSRARSQGHGYTVTDHGAQAPQANTPAAAGVPIRKPHEDV